MTAELLASIAGAVLSLGFSYIPKFDDWYDKLAPNAKRLIMLGALLVTALAIFGIGCTKLYDVQVTCDMVGALGLLRVFITAAIANQVTYKLSPQ